ncbi:possible gliding motility-related protein [Kordia algicida OT-1]|uniref:Possible gliding motility-related protein n=1 Tax=Kordia algicida OT-1 TaxID=391587 RepID=A9DL74_9FLAO|nr:gliding motility lipoprotein GldD [Kordia algicida]EDP98496.1 possible gliding motility-related protein [Kordia algicida OT-1]
MKILNYISIILVLSLLFISCEGEVLPKPKAFLRLEYPKATYAKVQMDCPYTFEKNELAVIQPKKDCWMNLDYPLLNGTVHLSYIPVENNLEKLVEDIQKLTYEHAVKADAIEPTVYENKEQGVYGMVYEVEGNAASQAQFYVTDSTKHFLTGSLYFNVKPNYDSIYPAVNYIKKDIRMMIESLKWED